MSVHLERHRAVREVPAPPEDVYRAFVTAPALAAWLPPRGARGTIVEFDPKPGGAFRMILEFDRASGKSGPNSDVIDATFLVLLPGKEVALAVTFVSDHPEFAGTMTMTWTLTLSKNGTLVTCAAEDVPPGITRADHEEGMASSLSNLADYLTCLPSAIDPG